MKRRGWPETLNVLEIVFCVLPCDW